MESATILISQTFKQLKKALSLHGYVAISYEKRKKFFSLTRLLLSTLISNMRAGSLKVEASDRRYDLSKYVFCQRFVNTPFPISLA